MMEVVVLLTEAKVRNALAKGKPYRLRDGQGLFLSVRKTGLKVWWYCFEWKKKNQTLTLGTYPAMSLAEARELRVWARGQLDKGCNPTVLFSVHQATEREVTFEVVAREWHEYKKKEWVPHHANDVIESFEVHVFPHVGGLPIKEVGAPALLKLLQIIERRPAPDMAKRVRQRISAVFGYAIATGRAESDPSAVLGKLLAPIRKGRQPALRGLTECRDMLRAVEATPASPVTKLAMRFLALTVVRPGVIIGLPWLEVHSLDRHDPTWVVPPQRMKVRLHYKDDERRAHKVPLAPQAVEILEAVHVLTRMSPFVFPNDWNSYKPMSENALAYLLHRAGYHRRHVPHGWRASFSTIMNERRPRDSKIIDLMLSHMSEDEVEAAYNRAEHMEIRREIAQEWADLLLGGFPSAGTLLDSRRFDRLARDPRVNVVAPPSTNLPAE